MKKIFQIILILSVSQVFIIRVQAQTVIAHWNFDDSDLYIDGGTLDNQGKLIQNSAAGTYTFPAGAGGSGYACSSNKWEAGLNVWSIATYDYYYDPLVTTGYGCLTISSVQRSSSTGPKYFTMEYSFDSWVWYTVPGAANIVVGNDYTTGVVSNVSLPSSCDNQPMVFIRWAMQDLTAVGGGNVAGTGTSRIDNIVLQGYAVPDPAGNISGPVQVSQGQTGVVYSIIPIPNATYYNWYLPTGATIVSGANTNSITVDFGSGAVSGDVSVEGVNSCSVGTASNLFVTVNASIPKPTISVSGATSICLGDSVVLQSSNADSYMWTSGESSQSITVKPLFAGIYTYTVGVEINGIKNTSDPETIQVYALPVSNAGSDASVCSGDSVLIGGTNVSGNSYLWSPSTGLNNHQISNPYVKNTNATNASTTYSYILKTTDNSSGCHSTDTVLVKVHPLPTADAGNTVSINQGDSVMLQGSGGGSYSWTPAISLSNANIANPYAQPSSTTLYTLSVSDTNSCKANDTVSVVVNITTALKNGSKGNEEIIVFPNPFSHSTILQLKNYYKEFYTIRLRDVSGKLLREFKNSNSSEYNLKREDISSGMYFLEIYSSDAERLKTFKLIAE